MPEMKKYLNRDGLDEYNSLLPHSSAEMQSYVNDWMDAHPEASTTVQDGAITEPKLADKSVSLRTLADDTVHMLKGMMITGNRSGEVLTADDAYSAPPVALTVEGKSTQTTTTGKNLFDNTNTPLGYYNASNGVFVSNNNYRWWSVPVTGGDVVRYTNCPDCILTYYQGGTFVGHGSQTQGATYTVPSGVDEVRGYCPARTWATGIVTKNNADLTYEPYTGGKPAPSPEYPQEIVSVDGCELEFHGANMWGGAQMAEDFNALKAVAYGSNGHGDYIEFEQGGGLPNGATFYPCPFKDDTQYTVILAFENTRETSGYTTIVVVYTDGTIKEINGPNADGSYGQFAFVTAANKTVDHFRGVLRTVDNRYYYNQCGIFEGVHTVADFQPYSSTIATVLPEGTTLRSLPDGTKDTLALSYLRPSTREGWAWYAGEVTRAVGEFDLANLTDRYGGSEKNVMYKKWADGASSAPARVVVGARAAICASFMAEGATSLAAARSKPTNTVMLCQTGDVAIMVTVDATKYPTVAGFKELFAGVMVYYKLSTPTTTTLDPIELPILPAPNCTVWSDPSTGLQMEYVRDSNIVIQRIEEAIADQ